MSSTIQPVSAKATWYPQLDGLGLPRALSMAVQQAYALIYALRDAVEQQQLAAGSAAGGGGATAVSGNFGIAYQSSPLTLPGTPTDVPGVTLTLSQAGRWLVFAVLNISIIGADQFAGMVGRVLCDGTVQSPLLELQGPADLYASVSGQWLYTAPAVNKVVKLQAYKLGGTGTSATYAGTEISALFLGP